MRTALRLSPTLTPSMPPRMTRLRFITAGVNDGTPGAGAAGGEGGGSTPTPADIAARAAAQASGTAQNGSQDGAPAGQGQASSTGAEKVEDLPDWAQKLIRDTRAEAAGHRTKATAAEQAQQTMLDKIAVELGLKTDGDTAPKPEELTAQVATSQAEARTAKVELAVFRAATGAGADPQALLDSRTFLDTVKEVDPTDTKAITDAITKAITDNPRLKATQAAARSGNDLTGGTGENRTRTPKSLTDAVAGAYAGQ